MTSSVAAQLIPSVAPNSRLTVAERETITLHPHELWIQSAHLLNGLPVYPSASPSASRKYRREVSTPSPQQRRTPLPTRKNRVEKKPLKSTRARLALSNLQIPLMKLARPSSLLLLRSVWLHLQHLLNRRPLCFWLVWLSVHLPFLSSSPVLLPSFL